MKEKHIGIIIQNQDDKILLYDDTYYIKVEIHENDNINNVIASKVKEAVDMNIFKIIETYVYTPDSKLVDLNILSDEEFIMYLVEVCIYHNEFNFVKKEDLSLIHIFLLSNQNFQISQVMCIVFLALQIFFLLIFLQLFS